MTFLFRDLHGAPPGPRGSLACIGAFDGLHLGHRALVRQAVARARALEVGAVAVGFEPLPREFFARDAKPPRLMLPRAKIEGLRELGADAVGLLRFDAKLAAMPAEAFVRELLVERLGVRELRQRSRVPLCIGVEFVDREDTDILDAYLKGKLDEEGFLERLYPTSLLLSRQGGRAHLEILRFAREAGIPVVALETRPAGSRPRPLRHGEIRGNLFERIGRHPEERLVVLYGVDHILGEDPITAGIDVPTLVITSYGDSVPKHAWTRSASPDPSAATRAAC